MKKRVFENTFQIQILSKYTSLFSGIAQTPRPESKKTAYFISWTSDTPVAPLMNCHIQVLTAPLKHVPQLTVIDLVERQESGTEAIVIRTDQRMRERESRQTDMVFEYHEIASAVLWVYAAGSIRENNQLDSHEFEDLDGHGA